MSVTASRVDALNPYEGSEDLNADVALQLDGVLFMEGEGEPVEVTPLKRDLRSMGDDSIETGSWLVAAMEGTWEVATVLLDYPALADLVLEAGKVAAPAGLLAEAGVRILLWF